MCRPTRKFRKNYEKFAGSDSPGCNISFELAGDYENFYNRLQMLKSPSFGTEFSNCCPYVYLAHYSLINSVKGRSVLEKAGLTAQVLRLSVMGEVEVPFENGVPAYVRLSKRRVRKVLDPFTFE